MSGVVLSLCDRTGVMVQPWLDAGHECWIVDMQHPAGVQQEGNLLRIGADVRRFHPDGVEFAAVFAFPPCTDLAISGARWFRDKGLPALIEGLQVVQACREICEASGAPWLLENPVGVLSTYWRPPDHTFDPCDYGGYLDPPGDTYRKKTCLWTGGEFVMPPAKPVQPIGPSPIHWASPGPDRGDRRSVTPEGFARAVYEFNRPGAPRQQSLLGGAA